MHLGLCVYALLIEACLFVISHISYLTTRQTFLGHFWRSFRTGHSTKLSSTLLFLTVTCNPYWIAKMSLPRVCIRWYRIKRVVGRKDDRQSDWNDDELQAGGTSRIYLVTTSTAMADERTWEREYCVDDHYKAPTEEDRAKIQVHFLHACSPLGFYSWAWLLLLGFGFCLYTPLLSASLSKFHNLHVAFACAHVRTSLIHPTLSVFVTAQACRLAFLHGSSVVTGNWGLSRPAWCKCKA